MIILDGKKIAKRIIQRLKTSIKKRGIVPGLAVILVGKDPESVIYVGLKEKAARKIGIRFARFGLPAGTKQKNVLELVQKLNNDKKIHGIIVQMPLPKHLDPNPIIKAVRPEKDVDGFRPKSAFLSPTHQGVLRLIKEAQKKLKDKPGAFGKKSPHTGRTPDKNAVILTKNPIFANPLANLLKKKGFGVAIELIKGTSLSRRVSAAHTGRTTIKKADVLIVALGKPKFIKPEMVKKNSIIIDVGYNRIKDKPAGDVDPRTAEKVLALSPVPGGIGPLTVAYLLKNVYSAAKKLKAERSSRISK